MDNDNQSITNLAFLYATYRQDPLKFFRDVLRVELDSQQAELILEAVKPRSRVMVKSARGTGKSFVITGLTIYFLLCFKDVNIRILSPSEQQLKTVFMRELRKHISNMHPTFKDILDVRSMSIFNKAKGMELNEAHCVTASTEKTENVSGVHSAKQVYLLDEASAIPDNIYSTIIGSLGTAEGGGHIIGVSNPTRGDESFYSNLFFKNVEGWKLMTFTADKCPRIPKEFIEEMKEIYGEDGDEYRVSVLGEFPRADGSTFIPESLVEEAVSRYISKHDYIKYPVVLGVDIARSLSGDSSVIVVRQGPKLHEVVSFKTNDTMEVVSRLIDVYRSYKVAKIYTDATGVGGGPTDRLKEIFRQRGIATPVEGVMVGNTSHDPLQYRNIRTELWGEMREWLATADIPDNYPLRRELISMRWGYTGKMAMQLIGKKQLKKAGVDSPDHADALALTFYDTCLTTNHSLRVVKAREIRRSNKLWV